MDFQYQQSSEFEVREAIIELYLNVKIRSSEEVCTTIISFNLTLSRYLVSAKSSWRKSVSDYTKSIV